MPEYVSHPLIKPDTVSSREYQLTLARTALERSSLIVLPTGLGKTIIALFVMIERLGDGKKVLMLSPTKPLVEQHAAFLRRVLTIDPEQVAVFTGSVAPEQREEVWKRSRVVVSTPQVIENDVLMKRFDLRDVSLIIFDEAHRATGDYAYVYIAKKYKEQSSDPLVLGITASPGSTPEKINEVKQNLSIEHVELKTENDPDVSPYIYEKDVEWVKVDVPDKAAEIKILLDSLMDDRLDRLRAMGVLYNTHLNKKELLMLQAKLQASISRGGSPESYKAVSILAEIMKIEHAVDLIQTQGVVPLKKYFDRLKEEAGSKGGSKATKRLMQDARLAGAIRVAGTADEVNPKTEKVKEIVVEQLKEKPSSRIIVFTNFRDTAEFVSRELAAVEGVKPVRFVGQASKLNDKGLSQKKQVEILDAFRAGEFNTLIATSVAEEGLDIPSTDLVIFYEPVPSEIRSIQRRGRTGRNAVGRVIVLISKGTRDEGTYRVSQAKEKKMYRTMNDMKDGQRMSDMLENGGAPAKIPETTPPLPAQGQTSLGEFGPKAGAKEAIEIYVDMREMRSAVVKNLEDMKASLSIRTLDVGDYVLSDRVCVERKTTDDFLDTLFGADRSLFEQIIAMKHAYMRPLLLIEGDGLYTKRRISPNVIHGVLASIAVDYGVTVLFTANEAETASFLFSIARREQAERKRSVNPHAQKASHTLAERQEYLVSAISEVGPVISKNLLRHFGSVKNIVSASKEELMEVDKVGEKTAAKIREVMDSEYRPRE
ncbi:putative ATP-dependent helicase [Methanocella paludicola SANAE]|uniref:ATP-dependent helicase n=1 Tax=Methanocella paludicola (strain DSM 17711 / JCM 13418 / NBRC 101707 / SANAE) TaxID=304371 RepID=D1YUU6_METPS|nr:DEAD/DEAH box helicase [Methanocella paludicola]BAI60218.1 putative ATP-dependent helicase [Methanocella paludicola SANAE]